MTKMVERKTIVGCSFAVMLLSLGITHGIPQADAIVIGYQSYPPYANMLKDPSSVTMPCQDQPYPPVSWTRCAWGWKPTGGAEVYARVTTTTYSNGNTGSYVQFNLAGDQPTAYINNQWVRARTCCFDAYGTLYQQASTTQSSAKLILSMQLYKDGSPYASRYDRIYSTGVTDQEFIIDVFQAVSGPINGPTTGTISVTFKDSASANVMNYWRTAEADFYNSAYYANIGGVGFEVCGNGYCL